MFLHTPLALNVEKKQLFFVLPYLGNFSLALGTRLQNVLTKIFLIVRSRLSLSPRHVLVIISVLKNKVPFNLLSNLV